LKFDFQVCANEPNAFSLSSGGIKDGTAKPAILDNLCTLDYTEIIGNKSRTNIFVLYLVSLEDSDKKMFTGNVLKPIRENHIFPLLFNFLRCQPFVGPVRHHYF
jgi:hypothetical protein